MSITRARVLYGSAVRWPGNVYRSTVHVIGEVARTPNGNTALRVGYVDPTAARAGQWVSGTAHIVLTPEERRALIAELLAHDGLGDG